MSITPTSRSFNICTDICIDAEQVLLKQKANAVAIEPITAGQFGVPL
jgi:hypothetical protein